MGKRDIAQKISGFVQTQIVQQAVRSIGWVLAAFAVGIGATLILAPAPVVIRPTFAANLVLAPPHVWGFGYIVLGVWGSVALGRNVSEAPLPMYFLAALTSLWGLCTVPSIARLDGSVTAVWPYTALALICVLVGASVDAQQLPQKDQQT